MAYSYDAYAFCSQVDGLFFGMPQQRSRDVLGNRGCIATRCIDPFYGMSSAIFGIDVVKSDCGRSDKAAATSFEKIGIATGTGTDYQHIGIMYRIVGDFLWRKVAYIGIRFENPLYKRYLIVDDDRFFFFS